MRLAPTFVALDFETADTFPDSACAVGAVRSVDGRIVRRHRRLIRPPRPSMLFTHIHGIEWRHVQSEPSFREIYPELLETLHGVDFIAAHNASFDRNVLEACCRAAGLRPPRARFLCTVQLARRVWNLRPTTLAHVSRYLGVKLNHHEPLSDAEACAQIVLAAWQDGAELIQA